MQPRRSRDPKGGKAEPIMSRRRQQTGPGDGSEQDFLGAGRRACDDSSTRNKRGPTQRPMSGEGGSHKPMAKGDRAGRESERFVVPLMPVATTPVEGRDPALVARVAGGRCEGMTARSNNPVDKVRELQHALFRAAKRDPGRPSREGTRAGVSDALRIEVSGKVVHRRRRRWIHAALAALATLPACVGFDPNDHRLRELSPRLPRLRVECDPLTFLWCFGGNGTVEAGAGDTARFSYSNGFPSAAVEIVQTSAPGALGKIGGEEAVRALLDRLSRQAPGLVGERIVGALRDIARREGLRFLVPVLSHRDALVRRGAAGALAAVVRSTKQPVAPRRSDADNPEPPVAVAVETVDAAMLEHALSHVPADPSEIRPPAGDAAEAARTTPRLVQALLDDDECVRLQMALAVLWAMTPRPDHPDREAR